MSLSRRELIQALKNRAYWTKGEIKDDALCQLAALEIENLEKEQKIDREVIAEANNSLYGSQGYFLSLNGGRPQKYHLASGIENLKKDSRKQYREIETLKQKNTNLEWALEMSRQIDEERGTDWW